LTGSWLTSALDALPEIGVDDRYRGAGKRPAAQEHLTTATTMSREMDMAFWLEKAEAEIRNLT